MITKYTGADVEGYAAIVAAARYGSLADTPEDYWESLVFATGACLECSEVEREVLLTGSDVGISGSGTHVIWWVDDDMVAELDAAGDTLTVRVEAAVTAGRVIKEIIDTTAMTPREVVETAARAARIIREDTDEYEGTTGGTRSGAGRSEAPGCGR